MELNLLLRLSALTARPSLVPATKGIEVIKPVKPTGSTTTTTTTTTKVVDNRSDA